MNIEIQAKHIHEASQRIAPYILRTPVLTNPHIDSLLNARIYFKCENLQRIGAFKARGAFNALLQIPAALKKNGVATHSSGNHAQALALAAKNTGTQATIVMPENSPDIKIKGVRELGAQIVFCEATQQAREETLARIVKETGAFFVPPYNHEWIIAGQATAALEALKQVSAAEVIIAPLGGGGLLSGTALTAKYSGLSIDVFGAEPAEMDDGKRSFDSGVIQANKPGAHTIADGLRTQVGQIPFGIIKSNVKDIFTVTEEEIVQAMRLIWERLKVVVEPSAAVPLAAAIKHQRELANKNVIIILSGGNTDLDKLPF